MLIFSCKQSSEDYNSLFFQGKEEKNINLLQQGFDKAEPYFSQLCAEELCDLLTKQKALELAEKAVKKYPKSTEMIQLYLGLLYEQREFTSILEFAKENSEILKNNEINRFYLSALLKANFQDESKYQQEIKKWYKENKFSISHNRFYKEFISEIDFDFGTIARYYAYNGNQGKSVSVLEGNFDSQEDFFDFFASLSYNEFAEIGDAFVYGSSNKLKYADLFGRFGLISEDEDVGFYSLFTAGRLNEKVQSSSYKNLEYYRAAIYLAPETSFDRAIWYYIRAAINCSLEDGKKAFLDFSTAWKDPLYFDDLIDLYTEDLLSSKQWNAYYEFFSMLYPYLSDVSQGKTDYIFGTLIENDMLEKYGFQKDYAFELYEKSYNNINTDAYYKFLAGTKLNKPFVLEEDFLFFEETFDSPKKDTEISSEEKHFLYLAEQNPKEVYDFYIENQEKISEEVALKSILSLEKSITEDKSLYPKALRIANAAVIDEKNVKYLYPRYFQELVTEVCNEFGVLEYVFYSLIRTESFFDSNIYSSAGAIGLCQLMPTTASDEARKLKYKEYDLLDAKTNATFGAHYLAGLTNRLDGNVIFALCSYNAGLENLRKWRRANPNLPIDIFIETIPFEETRNYAKKLIKASCFYGMIYYNLSPRVVLESMGILDCL